MTRNFAKKQIIENLSIGGEIMRKTITALIMLVFSFGVVGTAIASGEATSCYKWSYNTNDGYVADRGDYGGAMIMIHSTARIGIHQATMIMMGIIQDEMID